MGQENSIEVSTDTVNEEYPFFTFKGKKEFYGIKKDIGGWLKGVYDFLGVPEEHRKGKKDFTITPRAVVTEPIENILHSAKLSIDGAVKASGATEAIYFLGEGDSFREELSTLQKYKGNRDELEKPLLFDQLVDYLKKKYKPEVITGYEADDALVMKYIELENQGVDAVIIAVDKDSYGTPVKMYNPQRPQEGVVDCRGFGELYRDDKGKVRGKGRLFKYFQICSQDKIDNYKAHCFSDVKWGDVSAYNALKGCKNDKEAFEAMVGVFKKLYPEPKEVEGWRGDTITIDWLYVWQEMIHMAHMHRVEGDYVDVKAVLGKLGVVYE